MLRRSFLLCPVFLASCVNARKPVAEAPHPAPVPEPPPSSNTEAGTTTGDFEKSGIERFQREYSRYEVGAGYLPDFKWREFKNLSRQMTVLTAGERKLTLKIGQEYSAGHGYRTTSRYRLSGIPGHQPVEAESLITTPDIGRKGRVEWAGVLYDMASGAFIVSEESYWNQRIIIFEADGRVRYPVLPRREAIPPRNHSSLSGYKDGLIYFTADGHNYAIPLEQLKEQTSPEYSIG